MVGHDGARSDRTGIREAGLDGEFGEVGPEGLIKVYSFLICQLKCSRDRKEFGNGTCGIDRLRLCRNPVSIRVAEAFGPDDFWSSTSAILIPWMLCRFISSWMREAIESLVCL